MGFEEDFVEEIIANGIEYLDQHLFKVSVATKKGVTAIRDLYDLVDSDRYEGVIYRGIGVWVEKLTELLKNNSFHTDEWEDSLIESWTIDEGVAQTFALQHSHTRSGTVGIVLKSHTDKEPVIFDLLDDTYYALKKVISVLDGDYKFINPYTEDDSRKEDEVLIEHTGGKFYTYCEDVPWIVIDNIYYLRSYQEETYHLLLDKVVEEDREYFIEIAKDYEVATLYLQCDDQGRLHIDD